TAARLPARSRASVASPGRSRRSNGAAAAAGPTTSLTVLRQFRELFRVSQQHFQRIERSCGISGAQLWALHELARNPGLTVSELARLMSIHLSTSSNLIGKLEARGLVRRERSTEDQRVVRLHAAATARKLLARAPRPVEGVLQEALSRMPRQALKSLERDLGRLLALASVRSRKAQLEHMADP
ncbi:MAG TPA: MarR family transcriptional regulator, partial [Casimicrobiaceae bacterium]|nr:MarR family transcriptional regulator [Casimicrobiaceae bacterium]